MRARESPPRFRLAGGFTLPAVLVVTAALLILAVGILLVAGVERDTARSFVDRQRADLAARAGLEELRGILATEAANDDFIVLQSTLNAGITPGSAPAPHLFIGRGNGTDAGGNFTFRYIPLFSALAAPDDAPLQAPKIEPLVGAAHERLDFTTLPYQDKARAAWRLVKDENDRVVARYAYWVEDLQARVDPAIAGNAKGSNGTHARAAWPFPAPGLNDRPESPTEPALDQIAMFALVPDATDGDQKDLQKTLIKNRGLLVSPDSPLAAAGIKPPLVRLKTEEPASGGKAGELANEKARAVEEGLVPGIRAYEERPLVPFAAGIDPAAAGKPKLNLNKLLATNRDAAVVEMADFIQNALPDFENRKGGFPDHYLKTLAANALDYADEDNEATIGGGHRGIDGYPLVSEFFFRTRWEDVRVVGRRKYLDLSASVYVELWNMTNVPVEGKAQVSYETAYQFQIPPNPNLFTLGNLTASTTVLENSGGANWFPAFDVKLAPNEYRLFHCGTVSYSYDALPSSGYIASPITFSGDEYGRSGYRLRWNGRLVDMSRGGVHRFSSSIHYPDDGGEKDLSRQRYRTTIPGHSHDNGTGLINNMGDARMSFYNQAPQAANIYPQNSSPNRRNIRMGSVYNTSANLIYGRVLPSEWPDGGHDSPFGTNTVHELLGLSATDFEDQHRIDPDAPGFYSQPPDLALGGEDAPARLSNAGRFHSATELGRTYDPVMWRVRQANETTGKPGTAWGDVLAGSASSTDHGGGNTLRIGRPEHPAFDTPKLRAAHLLDLFHTGHSRSEDAARREGPLAGIEGHINLNTASKSALRQMIAGGLTQDPGIRSFTGASHTGGKAKFPACSMLAPAPDLTAAAERIANAIVRSRPYAGAAELANARESDGTPVFGNARLISGFASGGYPILQWTDSAAEEGFARTYEASTVRSRNFRIWVVGQTITPTASTNAAPEVLAEVRKVFTVFADPGERNPDGSIDPAKFRLKPLHENDF
jgi:type II secretory pathway pseudopilin PulG